MTAEIATLDRSLSNLLASKDPLAFQQVQAVSVPEDTGYTGPYLSGDEIELETLEKIATQQDAFFNNMMDDSE
jgi:hypothetical protein